MGEQKKLVLKSKIPANLSYAYSYLNSAKLLQQNCDDLDKLISEQADPYDFVYRMVQNYLKQQIHSYIPSPATLFQTEVLPKVDITVQPSKVNRM